MKLIVSLLVVAVIAVTLSRSLKLSSKYDRKPEKTTKANLSEWNAMDHGIDPTDDAEREK